MHLYLSSFRLGDRRDELAALVAGRKVALIANALDNLADDVRSSVIQRGMADLADIGVGCDPIDLRSCFAGTADIRSVLSAYPVLFVTGGNCFLLRRAMRQ